VRQSAKGKAQQNGLKERKGHGFFRVFYFNATIDGPPAEIESTLGRN